MAVNRPASLIGRVVADYRLERLLGIGGMGAVFLGQRDAAFSDSSASSPTSIPDEVAVKILLMPWSLGEEERREFKARFVLEAELLRTFSHPNIIRVYDSGESDDIDFIRMPYLSGGTLLDGLQSQGVFALDEVNRHLSVIADALDYVHHAGVIHRDIKTSNVLLDGNGAPYLYDFSIALVGSSMVADDFQGLTIGELFGDIGRITPRSRLTSTGSLMGTPLYMAPELFENQAATPASDLYSLGVVTYELVTGVVPYRSDSYIELFRMARERPIPPLRHQRPELPEPAEAAILQALAKRPEDRFSSAADFAIAFARGLDGVWVDGLRIPDVQRQNWRGWQGSEAITEPNSPVVRPRKAQTGWFPWGRAVEQSGSGVALLQAFVSYSRVDLGFVDELETNVRRDWCDVWVDRRKLEGGQLWEQEIERAIKRCHVCIIVLSPTSVTSPYVEQEYSLALKKKKVVIPLLYQACDVPHVLRRIHWIDFVEQPVERGLDNLMKALDYYARVRSHRR